MPLDPQGLFALNPNTGYLVFKAIPQLPGVTSSNYQLSPAGINTQSGTSYTLAPTDNGELVVFTSSSSVALTVPTGLGAGFTCSIIQYGTGQVTISAASGVTLQLRASANKTAAQYAIVSLVSVVANEHIVTGDTSA